MKFDPNSNRKPFKTDAVSENIVEETKEVETVETIETGSPVIGVVTGCTNLCVRKEPSVGAEIIAIVSEDAKLKITNEFCESDEWYAVTTISDSHFTGEVSGFCMKKYIAVVE